MSDHGAVPEGIPALLLYFDERVRLLDAVQPCDEKAEHTKFHRSDELAKLRQFIEPLRAALAASDTPPEPRAYWLKALALVGDTLQNEPIATIEDKRDKLAAIVRNAVHALDGLPPTLSDEDIDQIVEGIEHFIIYGDADVDEVWHPYIEKLNALKMVAAQAPPGATPEKTHD